MRIKPIFALAALVVPMVVTGLAFAEALVKVTDSGVEPGLVQSWTGDEREVELTLRSDADPLQVAEAIESAVERVRAKVRAGKVVVRGKSVEELMPLLADVEVGGDAALAELAQLEVGQDSYGSGSSLRAKKKKRIDAAFKDRSKVAVARVLAVEALEFPDVKLTVQVLSSPTGSLKKKVFKGKRIVVRPEFARTETGKIDFEADNTRVNLVAYYLEPNDRVKLRLEKELEGGEFLAGAIAR